MVCNKYKNWYLLQKNFGSSIQNMSVLPNTLKHSKIRSAIEIFLHIKSPDQDQTGTTLRNQSKESKEFSLMTKSRKLC